MPTSSASMSRCARTSGQGTAPAFEDTTAKVVKYDLEGHFLYAWGTLGDHPGGFFNMHGASTDQQGNLYIAEVGNGRLQKFRPRAGANKAFLVGPPVYAAWR